MRDLKDLGRAAAGAAVRGAARLRRRKSRAEQRRASERSWRREQSLAAPLDFGAAESSVAQEQPELQRAEFDEHLPIQYVLADGILRREFDAFSRQQHASENLLFYQAVEAFKKHRYTTPNETLRQILEDAQKQQEQRPQPTPKPAVQVSGGTLPKKRSHVDETRMHMNVARLYKLPMRRVGVIVDALKIYETFLQDGARMWVCISPKVLDDVASTLLKEPEKTRQNIFAKAQNEAYVTMERDMVPRFLDTTTNPEVHNRVRLHLEAISKKRLTIAESLKRQSTNFVKRLSMMPTHA